TRLYARYSISFGCFCDLPDLLSFPTRRSSDLPTIEAILKELGENIKLARLRRKITTTMLAERAGMGRVTLRKVENGDSGVTLGADRKSTRLNSSHVKISYAVFCLKKKIRHISV